MVRTGMRRWAAVAALAVGVALAGCGTAPPPRAAAGPPTTAAPPTAVAAPVGTAGTGPTRSATPGATVGGVVPDVPLPDEGGRSSSPETTDWTTEIGTARSWLLDPCSPTDYPTDARRTGFKTVSRTGPEFHEARQLATYPSAGDAAEVMAGFRRALAACSTGSTGQGARWEWVTREEPTLGDEGLLAASTVGGPGFAPAGDRVAVTRVGASVFLAFSNGESSAAEIDGAADLVRDVAREFLDSL